MFSLLISGLQTLRVSVRSRAALQLEILALRHQLQVLQRPCRRRAHLTQADRLLWMWLSRTWTEWRSAIVIVRPETVIAWHRRVSPLLELEEPSPDRPTGSPSRRSRADSQDVASEPTVGAPRLHGELLKLGIEVGESSVATYIVRHRRPPSQSWRTFLANHIQQIMAADFFVVPTTTGRLLFVLVMLAHHRRRVVHVAVTEHPTAACTAQQFREAFPWDAAPRYLIRDRDLAFAAVHVTADVMAISEVLTPPRSPWQNGVIERFIGSVRRECRDHVVIFTAAGLQRLLKAYVDYYQRSRPHVALNKDAPISRPVSPANAGPIIAIPQVGALHHRYERVAA